MHLSIYITITHHMVDFRCTESIGILENHPQSAKKWLKLPILADRPVFGGPGKGELKKCFVVTVFFYEVQHLNS